MLQFPGARPEPVFYPGQDLRITIGDFSENFADLTDLTIGVRVNLALQSTERKSGATIVAHPTNPKKCLLLLTRAQTALWPEGYLILEIAPVYTSADFPAGERLPSVVRVGRVDLLTTKNEPAPLPPPEND